MKLIDLLVQELPGRGGWPASGRPLYAVQDKDREVKFAFCDAALTFGRISSDRWGSDARESWFDHGRKHIDASNFKARKLSSDHEYRKVTLEEYNYALAASQQPEWSVEGLPPEGIECEVKSGKNSWTLCKIAHSSSAGVAFIYLEEPSPESSSRYIGVIDCIPLKHALSYFRPLRTEAERKREEYIAAIIANLDVVISTKDDAVYIYDAIASGKIPGIRLE